MIRGNMKPIHTEFAAYDPERQWLSRPGTREDAVAEAARHNATGEHAVVYALDEDGNLVDPDTGELSWILG